MNAPKCNRTGTCGSVHTFCAIRPYEQVVPAPGYISQGQSRNHKHSPFFFSFPYFRPQQQELSLYDRSLLLDLDFSRSPAKFSPPISAANPGEPWMKVRPLQTGDFHRGFLQILSQLTSVGDVSLAQFLSKSLHCMSFFN